MESSVSNLLNSLSEFYHHPNNWPLSLVGTIEDAYSRMRFTINSLKLNQPVESGYGYSESCLCKRCRDVICLATEPNEPWILKLETELRDHRSRSFKARQSGQLKEGYVLGFDGADNSALDLSLIHI